MSFLEDEAKAFDQLHRPQRPELKCYYFEYHLGPNGTGRSSFFLYNVRDPSLYRNKDVVLLANIMLVFPKDTNVNDAVVKSRIGPPTVLYSAKALIDEIARIKEDQELLIQRIHAASPAANPSYPVVPATPVEYDPSLSEKVTNTARKVLAKLRSMLQTEITITKTQNESRKDLGNI